MHHNPVYVPDEDTIAKIREAAKETPAETHWDPKGDNRQRGAAYVKLGDTMEEREKTLAELEAARQETIRKRREMGADTGEATSVIAAASFKRKQRNEERLAMMNAKRRKVETAKDAMDFLTDMEVALAQQA
jgi:Fe-S cluster biosynthesis and repair protein YggX